MHNEAKFEPEELQETTFPYAPDYWDTSRVIRKAQQEGIKVNQDHLQVVHALQEYFLENPGQESMFESCMMFWIKPFKEKGE